MRTKQCFLRFITAILLAALPISCAETARMKWADKMIVRPQIQKLASGGVEISMSGDALLNPTAALERFHQLAEKQLGGAPYLYNYRVEKADVTETYFRTEKTQRQIEAPSTASGWSTSTRTSSGYRPIFVPVYGKGSSSGIGSGEAAAIVASLIVLAILIEAISKQKTTTRPQTPVSAEPQKKLITVTETKRIKDQRVTGQVLKLTGTATPVAPLTWSKGSKVEVVLPSGTPVIGKMNAAAARSFAEATAEALKAHGYTPTIVSSPSPSAHAVRPVVLRAQGMMDAGVQQITVEYEFSDPANRSRPLRAFVQTANPFGGTSLTTSFSSAFDYRPAAIIAPLKKQLRRILP
jgi:hypothetical protein